VASTVRDGVEVIDRPSAWQRLGPFGQFLLGAIIVTAIVFAGVMALETVLALTVRVPTVDGLPDRIAVCGRTYHRAAGASQDLLTLDGIRATGIEPVVVLPLRMQPCTDGPCNRGWPGTAGCATVVFVRVEGDRYAAYDLLGGP
jgi:hypothetical protein